MYLIQTLLQEKHQSLQLGEQAKNVITASTHFQKNKTRRGGVWPPYRVSSWIGKPYKKNCRKILNALWLHSSAIILSEARQFWLGLFGLRLLGLGHESFIVRFIANISIFLTTFLLSFSTNHNFPFILLLYKLWLLLGLPNEQRSEKLCQVSPRI